MTEPGSSPAAKPTPGPAERLLVALDTQDLGLASDLVAALGGLVGGFKVGKEFFTALGPEGVQAALGNQRLFLDLKFHDIPNTVAGALRAALALRPFLINVHAAGGRAMMTAAAAALREGARDLGVEAPRLLAVTVLTSLDERDLVEVGQGGGLEDQVERLARLAQDCGLDGVVCSPHEIARLRAACGDDFLLVVPGIRPAWSATGDQKRVMTPGQALAAGADYLVIGRAITGASDPKGAAGRLLDDLNAGT